MSRLALLLPLLILVVSVGTAAAGDPEGHVNLLVGRKWLDSGDWKPAEKQAELGVAMSFGHSDWPVFIALDVLKSEREDDYVDPVLWYLGTAKFTGATHEVALGIRKIWNRGKARPYVGGGMTLITASVEYDYPSVKYDAEDTTLGPWLGGGVFWRLGSRFNLGFDVRWSTADVNLEVDEDPLFHLNTYNVKAGGLHAGVTFGLGW
ncbi:MAG TPA: outer membrane beta-barrel protein [Candidatus Polarisedimenticolaceae bacterium]